MATITITKAATCDGGGHHFLTITDGAQMRGLTVTSDDLQEPVTIEGLEAFALVCIRRAMRGLTPQQRRAKIDLGIEVVIT